MAAGELIKRPVHTGMRLAQTHIHQTDTTGHRPDSLVQEELQYYFDRHNVQDEGYELVQAFAGGARLEMFLNQSLTVRNVGSWQNQQKEGLAVVLDTLGRTVLGFCQQDTLMLGIRPDSLGLFAGDMHGLYANGHGAYFSENGGYFEGHWENDKRQGFGIELSRMAQENPRLRVGEWNKGKFQGERMRYTSERIYGIDIARYQHEAGRSVSPSNGTNCALPALESAAVRTFVEQPTIRYPLSISSPPRARVSATAIM